jgi:hypothetical protein
MHTHGSTVLAVEGGSSLLFLIVGIIVALRLARQRISVLFAMLRDGTFYESRTPKDVELAA